MPTNTYVPLALQTVSGSSTNTITFSSISQSYTDLVLVANLGMATAGDIAYVQVGNGSADTGNNYSYTQVYGDGSSAASSRTSNRNSGIAMYNATSNAFATSISHFMNYSNTTTNKTWLCRESASTTYTAADVNLWRSTAAINTIKIYTATGGNFTSGSTFALYGIAAQPALTAKATGGTIYYGADGYVYHAFTSSGTFTPSQSLTCDVLAIAGGGGGGHQYGGGGGAGGFLLQSGRSVSATGYSITIGAGGAAGNSSVGGNGNNTTFDTITALGGGGGGNAFTGTVNPNGANGGSGGGGTKNPSTTGTAGTATQGNSGGATGYGNNGGTSSTNYSGAGGGGAGGAGSNTPTSVGGIGAGGTSFANYALINSFGLTTNTGQLSSGNYYYAAGGSGNGTTTTALGGGGAGGFTATAGTANTGSGGGGGTDTGGPGGAGGSGLVIVRYLG